MDSGKQENDLKDQKTFHVRQETYGSKCVRERNGYLNIEN